MLKSLPSIHPNVSLIGTNFTWHENFFLSNSLAMTLLTRRGFYQSSLTDRNAATKAVEKVDCLKGIFWSHLIEFEQCKKILMVEFDPK